MGAAIEGRHIRGVDSAREPHAVTQIEGFGQLLERGFFRSAAGDYKLR